jgi:hypothetical protein
MEKAKLEKAKMGKEKTRATTLPKQKRDANTDSVAGSITVC